MTLPVATAGSATGEDEVGANAASLIWRTDDSAAFLAGAVASSWASAMTPPMADSPAELRVVGDVGGNGCR